jgi:uncharacterized protein YvpB
MLSTMILTTILSTTQINSQQIGEIFPAKPTTEVVTEEKIAMPYEVPLYSQIADISWTDWKQKGCGVADVAMLVNYYKPKTTNVQAVLEAGIKSGAYVKNVGWSHTGLASLAKKYGLSGEEKSFYDFNKELALTEFKKVIDEGPAIASIHRNFDPKLSFGHLIVITGYDDKLVYYNDPGKHDGIRTVSISQFMSGWKRKLIVIRPIEKELESDSNIQLALAN